MNKNRKYIKFWQSSKVLEGVFAKLSDSEKTNLYDCLVNIEKQIDEQNETDIFYSLIVHYLLNKINISKQIIEKIQITHNQDPFKSWETTGEQHDE